MIGANGAGKSTLLRTIAGLHRPTSAPSRSRAATSTRLPPQPARRVGHLARPRGPTTLLVDDARREPAGRCVSRGEGSLQHRSSLRALRLDARSAPPARVAALRWRAAGGRDRPRARRQSSVLLLDELSLGLAPIVIERIYALVPDIVAQRGQHPDRGARRRPGRRVRRSRPLPARRADVADRGARPT